MEPADSKVTDTLPPPHREDNLSITSNPSPLSPPRYGWTSERIARRAILSHSLCLVFGIPAFFLFSVDMHAYVSQVHPTPYSFTHPTRYFKSNLITNLDGIALAFISITILYAAIFLAFLRQTRQLLTPAIFYQHIIIISLTDYILGTTVFVVSTMSLSQRVATSNCQHLLYLDEGACDSYRRGIMKAAGSMGILTR
jgi:hypothetical protein